MSKAAPELCESTDRQQNLPPLDSLSDLDPDALDFSCSGRAQLVLHLHRFKDQEYLAILHGLILLDGDCDHQPWHRRFELEIAMALWRPSRGRPQSTLAGVFHSDRILLA